MESSGKTVWELLWDYDPNGLVVVDSQLRIRIVNAAFCEMFKAASADLVGHPVSEILDDADDFWRIWVRDEVIRQEKHYERHNLYVKKLMFAVRDQQLMACIMVDMTREWRQKEELRQLKEQTLLNVHGVVDRQMKVAQEIAQLLGETTADTKVSLLRLADMLKKDEL